MPTPVGDDQPRNRPGLPFARLRGRVTPGISLVLQHTRTWSRCLVIARVRGEGRRHLACWKREGGPQVCSHFLDIGRPGPRGIQRVVYDVRAACTVLLLTTAGRIAERPTKHSVQADCTRGHLCHLRGFCEEQCSAPASRRACPPR